MVGREPPQAGVHAGRDARVRREPDASRLEPEPSTGHATPTYVRPSDNNRSVAPDNHDRKRSRVQRNVRYRMGGLPYVGVA